MSLQHSESNDFVLVPFVKLGDLAVFFFFLVVCKVATGSFRTLGNVCHRGFEMGFPSMLG